MKMAEKPIETRARYGLPLDSALDLATTKEFPKTCLHREMRHLRLVHNAADTGRQSMLKGCGSREGRPHCRSARVLDVGFSEVCVVPHFGLCLRLR